MEKLNRCEADLSSAVETKQYAQCASLQQELHDLRSMRLRFIRKMLRGESAMSPHQLVMRIRDMETELKNTAERGDFTRCDTLQTELKEIKAQWQLLPTIDEAAIMVNEAKVTYIASACCSLVGC